jgi:hypothetical protein
MKLSLILYPVFKSSVFRSFNGVDSIRGTTQLGELRGLGMGFTDIYKNNRLFLDHLPSEIILLLTKDGFNS